MSDWLYGDGQESSKGVFINKINEIKEKIGYIQKRYENFENIRNEIANLISSLKSNFDYLNSLVTFIFILG